MSVLRERHARFVKALQAFEDPTVQDVPGLRLMQDALRERTDHLAHTVEASETLQVEVELTGPAIGGVDVAAASVVLAALQDAVNAAARAAGDAAPGSTALVLVGVEEREDGATLVLRRHPGPLEALAPDPRSDAPLVERAVDDVLAALDGDPPDALAVTVDALLRAFAAVPSSTVVRTAPAVFEPREVRVTRAEAVRRTTA